MRTKLWLDDLRPAPDESWEWLRTAPGAVQYIESLRSIGLALEVVSFDHDLGYRGASRYVLEEHDSRSVMNFIEREVAAGRLAMPEIEIHSANAAGRRWLALARDSVRRLAAIDR